MSHLKVIVTIFIEAAGTCNRLRCL